MTDAEDWAELAQDRMEAGDWDAALDTLEGAPADDGVRWLLEASVYLELGEHDVAAESLTRAAELLGEGDADVVRLDARVALATWDFERAAAKLDELSVDDWGADLLFDLALLDDALGRHDAAHARLVEARRIAPEHVPAPIRLDADAFQAVVEEAADALPDEFRAVFERVPVVIDPMPTAAVVDAPRSGHPPDLLGLYVGPPLSEYETDPGIQMPPCIFLFQRNLERIADDEEHLCEEIRITLYHELAHALGFEEDGVDAMGLA